MFVHVESMRGPGGLSVDQHLEAHRLPSRSRCHDQVDHAGLIDRLHAAQHALAQCESLGDPDAYNPYSGASGLFQFLPSTWASTSPKAGFPDASVFDPVANIGAAAWIANRYDALGMSYWQPWSCRRVLG